MDAEREKTIPEAYGWWRRKVDPKGTGRLPCVDREVVANMYEEHLERHPEDRPENSRAERIKRMDPVVRTILRDNDLI